MQTSATASKSHFPNPHLWKVFKADLKFWSLWRQYYPNTWANTTNAMPKKPAKRTWVRRLTLNKTFNHIIKYCNPLDCWTYWRAFDLNRILLAGCTYIKMTTRTFMELTIPIQNSVNTMSHGISVQLRSSSGFQSRLLCQGINKSLSKTWRADTCV